MMVFLPTFLWGEVDIFGGNLFTAVVIRHTAYLNAFMIPLLTISDAKVLSLAYSDFCRAPDGVVRL